MSADRIVDLDTTFPTADGEPAGPCIRCGATAHRTTQQGNPACDTWPDCEPVRYPPTDQVGWRRRAAALGRLHTALATAETATVGRHEEWSVHLLAAPDLADWLAMVEELVPAPQRDVLHFFTRLRLWSAGLEADDPPEVEPLVYGELASSDPELAGLSALKVVAPLWPAGEAAARSDHPELRRPHAELEIGREAWLRYVGAR